MPESSDFLKGFGIHKGLIIDGYKLIDINIEEYEIHQYREYEYNIRLLFNHIGDSKKFISQFKTYVKGNEIIKSRYGNPYKCNFGQPKIVEYNENQIVVESVGTAHRIY